METAPQWSELPIDILGVVFRRLLSFGEHVRASAVCPQWRAAAVGNPPRLPLLMVLPTAAPARIMGYVSVSPTCWMWDTTAAQLLHLLRLTLPSTSGPAFLRVFGDDVYRLPRFPDDALRGRFCGSFPGGWVALALEHYRGHCILNLHTGERIDLPDLVCTPSPPIDCITVIKYLTLSSSPTREGTFIVVAVTSGVANIAFWEPGAERWCPPTLAGLTDEQLQRWRRNLPRDPVDDILYFRGCLHEGFYVLNGDETLLVYVPEAGEGSNDKTPKVRVVSYLFQSGTSMTDPNSRVKARYLVETRGNLLMVRHLSSSDGSDQFEMFVLEGERSVTTGTVHAVWRKCSILTGRALFLGHGCSMAVETGVTSHVVMYCLSAGEIWVYP